MSFAGANGGIIKLVNESTHILKFTTTTTDGDLQAISLTTLETYLHWFSQCEQNDLYILNQAKLIIRLNFTNLQSTYG